MIVPKMTISLLSGLEIKEHVLQAFKSAKRGLAVEGFCSYMTLPVKHNLYMYQAISP